MSSIAQLVPRSASSAGQAGRRGKASEQVTRRVGGTKKKKQAPGASRDALKAKEEEYRCSELILRLLAAYYTTPIYL